MVSVLVPVYNGEKYISRCLDSLMAQEGIEIIVVDNCSEDNTVEIVSKYPVQLIRQEVNRGQNNSINRALDASHGDYIAECDADDYVLPNMYKTLYEAAHGADVVKCDFNRCANGNMSRWQVLPFGEIEFCPMDLPKYQRMDVLKQWPHMQSAIYRKDFILENNLRYRDNGVYEDTCLLFKILTTAKRYKYIPISFYNYTMDNPASGTATIRKDFAVCEQYEEICRWNKDHNLNLDAEIAALRFKTYMWNFGRASDKAGFMVRMQQDFDKDVPDQTFFSDYEWRIYSAIRGD